MGRFLKKRSFTKFAAIFAVLTVLFTYIMGIKGSVDTKATDLAQFPESYRPYIQHLMDLHPNWNFEVFNTNLDWNYVIDNEMVLTRNLIPASGSLMSRGWLDANESGQWAWYETPTAWKATDDVTGSFDWWANKWTGFDSGKWNQASRAAVSYVMDPRNWINEDYVFMFEKLSYSSSDTVENVNAALSGSFMYNAVCPGAPDSKSYAQVICDAAYNSGVSAMHLAVRLLYEKGTSGNDTLGNGVSTWDGENFYSNPWGSDGNTVYYNFFNINASGNGYTAIINNGGKEAKAEGWTSPYLAIMGGAKKVANGYINIGQDTLYFQKFSVVSPGYYFWKQYQQNLLAPLTEGSTVCRTYRSCSLEGNNFTFRIPVYTNMPENPAPVPMGPDGNYFNTGNPNNKLSSLSVSDSEGNAIGFTPSFDTDYLGTDDRGAYYAKVPYGTKSINITALPIAWTSYAYSSSGKPLDNYSLDVGDNVIDIICEAECGTTRTYRLIVNRKATDTGFGLGELQTNGSYLTGFSVGDSVSSAIGRMVINSSNGYIKILDSDRNEKTADSLIATGDIVDVCTYDGNIDMEYQIVIYGDVNGDGQSDILDYAFIKKYCWSSEKSSMSGAGLEAADVYPNSKGIDMLDMAVFKKYMWGNGVISQRR